MEERVYISILLDIYGILLTDKQREVMDYYYNDDLSLAEIGELAGTTRQGVHDLIKRCYNQLVTYEEKLQLLKRQLEMQKNIEVVLKDIDNFETEIDDKLSFKLESIKEKIKELL